jgi:hypothetical protein
MIPLSIQPLFLLALVGLFLHELDAIRQAEWRFFFRAPRFGEETAYRLFCVLHVPIFIVCLQYMHVRGFQLGMDVFLIGHALVHTLLRNHPLIQFRTRFSQMWIYGPALLAGIHLILVLRG